MRLEQEKEAFESGGNDTAADDTSEDEGEKPNYTKELKARIKELKNEIKEAKKRFKELQKKFIKRLHEARDALSDGVCRDIVLDIFNEKLASHLQSYVIAHRQEVIASVENWWDKYRVTLRDIAGAREAAAKKLDEITEGLGYGCRSNGNSSSETV